MGLKTVRCETVTEGPMDFLRGAAGAAGQKVATGARNVGAAVANTARDIHAAGQQASLQGDLQAALVDLAKTLFVLDKLKTNAAGANAGEQHQQAEEPPQQQQQQAEDPTLANNPFRTPKNVPTQQKPRASTVNRSGAYPGYGPQLQFSSYLQATHGERIDEGVWDFVKGAGSYVGSRIKDKINRYAGTTGEVLNDVIKAGRQASAEGDQRKLGEQLQQTQAAAQQKVKSVLGMVEKLGPNGAAMLKAAVAKIDPRMQRRLAYVQPLQKMLQPQQ
jgi:hypothetical protein